MAVYESCCHSSYWLALILLNATIVSYYNCKYSNHDHYLGRDSRKQGQKLCKSTSCFGKSKQIKTDASSRPSCSIKWQRLNATSTQCILNWIEPLQPGRLFKQDNLQNKTSSTILVSRENHEIYCHGTINYKVTIATFSLLLLFASLFALILMQLQCKTLLVLSCDPCLAQRVAM